jgi:two-component system sensor histidine kinase RegB
MSSWTGASTSCRRDRTHNRCRCGILGEAEWPSRGSEAVWSCTLGARLVRRGPSRHEAGNRFDHSAARSDLPGSGSLNRISAYASWTHLGSRCLWLAKAPFLVRLLRRLCEPTWGRWNRSSCGGRLERHASRLRKVSSETLIIRPFRFLTYYELHFSMIPVTQDRGYERLAVNAGWLLRLRWVAVAGQLITIGVAGLAFSVRLPLPALFMIIGFTITTNTMFAVWLRRHVGRHSSLAELLRDQRVLAVLMTLDLLALTALLYFTGGVANPFVLFYLLNVALAAVVLPVGWAWLLAGLATACFLGLSFVADPLPEFTQPLAIPLGSVVTLTHQQLGFLVSMVACGGVAVYFITRVTRELRQREDDLRVAEHLQARSERLEALATLAAGAAHELASPLSTIAVIAKDLSRQVEQADLPEGVLGDVRLIRSELDHCRRILNEMRSAAGGAAGEAMQAVALSRLLEESLNGIRYPNQVRIDLPRELAKRSLQIPLVATAQAIRGVIRNAFDASPPDSQVIVRVREERAGLALHVVDRGSGMPPEVVARIGEPFFTTKEPGQGMGLGLFLAKNVLNRLGGELQFHSVTGEGTTAIIYLPWSTQGES